MLSPEVLNEKEYVFVDGDYVNVDIRNVDKDRFDLRYDFSVYLNLYLILIKQFDEIEFRITEQSSTKISYFSGNNITPDSVLDSASGFINRARKLLEDDKNKYQIASATIKTSQFLNDATVAAIGSGKINEENYESYLPVVEYVTPNPALADISSLIQVDADSSSKLARESFTSYSFHVAEAYQTTSKNPRYKIPPPAAELVEKLRTSPSNLPPVTIAEERQKYEKKNVSIVLRGIIGPKLLDIASKSTLELQMIFYRKRVPKLKSSFVFKNSSEFENISMRMQDLQLTVLPRISGRNIDNIRVSNPNNFPVRYELRQHVYVNQAYGVSKIGTGVIGAKTNVMVAGKTDFGSKTESRCYTVSGIRDLPIVSNNSKIMSCVSISESRRVSQESIRMEAYIEPAQDGAKIVTRNVPEFVDAIKVTRTEKGYQEEKDLALLSPNSSYTDASIVRDGDYSYTLRFMSSGCEVLQHVVVPFLQLKQASEAADITFTVSLASTSKNGDVINHVLKIDESRQITVSQTLQDEIVTKGLSDKFDEEREDNKSQVSIVTRYKIQRVDLETGRIETVPGLYNPGQISLSFVGDPSHDYRYLVRLQAVNAASVSYLTVVTRQDTKSGNGYKFRYRKWQGYDNLRKQSLPSAAEINKNKLNDAVDLSGVGATQSVVITAGTETPVIKDLEIDVDEANRSNYLTWDVTGDVTEIDHFIVLGSYAGYERVIGTAAPVKFVDGSSYRFVDRSLAELVGNVSYRLILVQRGFKFSEPSNLVTYLRESNVPSESLLVENL